MTCTEFFMYLLFFAALIVAVLIPSRRPFQSSNDVFQDDRLIIECIETPTDSVPCKKYAMNMKVK